jgi:hypothetical protein
MKAFLLSILSLVAVIVTGCNSSDKDCNKQCKPTEPSASAKAFDNSLSHREEALQARLSEDRKEDRKDLREQESSLRLRQEREVESARLYAEKLKEFEFKTKEQSLKVEEARAKIDLRAVQQQNTTVFLRELTELKNSGNKTAASVADLARSYSDLNKNVGRGSDSLAEIAKKIVPTVVKETTTVTKTNTEIKEVIKYVDRPIPVPAPASPPTTTNAMGIVVNIGGVTFNLTPITTNSPPAVVAPKPAAPAPAVVPAPPAAPKQSPKAVVAPKAPAPAPAVVNPPAKAPVAKAPAAKSAPSAKVPVVKAGRVVVKHINTVTLYKGTKDWPGIGWVAKKFDGRESKGGQVITREYSLTVDVKTQDDLALAQESLDLFLAHKAKELADNDDYVNDKDTLQQANLAKLYNMFLAERPTLNGLSGMTPEIKFKVLAKPNGV